MCCYDAPLPAPRKPSQKDRAEASLYVAKLRKRATNGAAIARARRVGISKVGDHGPIAFGGG